VKERLRTAVGAKLNAGIELEYTRVPYCTVVMLSYLLAALWRYPGSLGNRRSRRSVLGAGRTEWWG